MSDNYSTIQQHQPLRTPAGWGKQEKALIVQLDEILDDVYRRFGRLRIEDMGQKFKNRLADDEGNIAQLGVDYGLVEARVESAEGYISSLQMTVEGVSIRVETAEGNLSTLTQTANGLTSRIETAEGDISNIRQTAEGLAVRIGSAEGDLSELIQKANTLTSKISNAEGDISTLQQTANGLISRITSAEGDVSEIIQSTNALSIRIANTEGNVSTLYQTTDGISAWIETADGVISSLSLTTNGIATRVESAEGNISALQQGAEGIAARIESAEGNVANLQITTSGLSARISEASGSIAELMLSTNGLSSRIQSAEGNISTIWQTTEGIATRVESAEGSISTLVQTANGLMSRVSSAEGNLSILQQTANGLMSRISNTEDNVVSLQITASGLQTDVENKISKTSSYQTAEAIVSTAVSTANTNTDTKLGSYSTTIQTSNYIASYVSDNAYGIINGITIDTTGITMTGKKINIGNWSFDNDGVIYTRGIYKMKIGDWSGYLNNRGHGGVFFSITHSTASVSDATQSKYGSIMLVSNVYDVDSETYKTAGYLKFEMSSLIKGAFYPVEQSPGSISLGTTTNVWYRSYQRNIIGPGSSALFFYPSSADETGAGWLMQKGLSNGTTTLYFDHTGTANTSIGQGSSLITYGFFANLYYTNISASSSRKRKHNIRAMTDIGERLDELKPVIFAYNNDPEERNRYGLIWEDTESILPDICNIQDGEKGINYMDLVTILLNEVQNLRKRVKALEGEAA